MFRGESRVCHHGCVSTHACLFTHHFDISTKKGKCVTREGSSRHVCNVTELVLGRSDSEQLQSFVISASAKIEDIVQPTCFLNPLAKWFHKTCGLYDIFSRVAHAENMMLCSHYVSEHLNTAAYLIYDGNALVPSPALNFLIRKKSI